MEIVHRFVLIEEEYEQIKFPLYGVKPDDDLILELKESDPHFKEITDVLTNLDVYSSTYTVFTRQETYGARFIAFNSLWFNEYPQPEEGYIDKTYNSAACCKVCGCGLFQKEPFRIRRETTWGGSKSMFHLNWVLDELFVDKKKFEFLFGKHNLSYKEVLIHKSGNVSGSTVQLNIPYADTTLDIGKNTKATCKKCGRKKYEPITKGFFPKVLADTTYPIFKTHEFFGTGTQAFNQIFVSNGLFRDLSKAKVKGRYIPCSE